MEIKKLRFRELKITYLLLNLICIFVVVVAKSYNKQFYYIIFIIELWKLEPVFFCLETKSARNFKFSKISLVINFHANHSLFASSRCD